MNSAALMMKTEMQTDRIEVRVTLPGRDQIDLVIDAPNGQIANAKLTGRGCPEMLRLLQEWRPKFTGALSEIELPKGSSHAAILLREAILKSQGQWKFPYQEEELCHCRAVATAKVDAAIIGGCHSIRTVARETSAGTSCGSCRPDTEAIIDYRLGKL